MSPGWRWDFEDEPRGPAPSAGPRTGTDGPPPHIRRRRLGAAVLVLLLAAVVFGASRLGTHHAAAAARPGPSPERETPKGSAGVAEPENDQDGVVASVLAYTPFVKEGGSRGHDVALTFDDGPGPYTPQVLDVLERNHVHATFFAIGAMEQYFGTSTEREIRDGDVIGDHTETHPPLATLSAHDQREQLFEQIARVELRGGERPVLFRPPYGSYDATTMKQLSALHLLMVLWSDDTDDYLRPGVRTIVERALEGAHPGAIILLHDAGGDRSETIAALPEIIKGIPHARAPSGDRPTAVAR